MKRGALLLVLFFFALLAPQGVIAAPVLVGKVTTESGDPLSDVHVDAEIAGKGFSADTDDSGAFSISVPSSVGRRVSVSLTLTRKNYDKLTFTRQQLWALAEIPSLDIGRIKMAASSGGAALSTQEKAYYAKKRSQEGNTLYLLPYKIVPANQSAASIDMEILAEAMQLAIGTWFQALEGRFAEANKIHRSFEPPGVIHLVPHEAGLTSSDVEKVKGVGHALNALAVVGGTGEVQEETRNVVNLTSRFTVIPTGNQGSRQYLVVDEDIPIKQLGSPGLSNRLNPQWAHNTLLAVCRREIALAQARKDRAALERVRAYLVAERSEARKHEKLKVQELELLLRQIEGLSGP